MAQRLLNNPWRPMASYVTEDVPQHRQAVLDLCALLRAEDLDVRIDADAEGERVDWARHLLLRGGWRGRRSGGARVMSDGDGGSTNNAADEVGGSAGRGSAANGAALKEKTGARIPKGDGERPGKSADQSDLLSASTGSASPADKAARTAYEDGRRLLSPASVEASRGQQISIDKRIMAGPREVSAAPGPVPADQIEQLRDRFAAVPGLAHLQRALNERRLVVLVGPEGSGRSTTGLWLLDECTDGAVSRLDPDAKPFLPAADQIAEGRGYLASIDRAAAPNRVAADRLAADLTAKGAYCVITAHSSPAMRRELGSYCIEHVQADPVAILGRQVQAGVEASDDDELGGRLEQLASSPEIARVLGPAARPSEAAQAAGLLLAYGRGERSREEIDTLIERLVLDDRIEEWFSVLIGVTHGQHADRARRLTAMRIAVAVFDGLPRHIAETTAERLAIRMAIPPAPPGDTFGSDRFVLPRTGPRGVDPDETATLLATTPITATRGEVPVFARTVPGETISYRDDRLPSAVLRCVWQNHYPLRAPVVAWLTDLSRDERQQVRFRAAQAAGLLCALDYTHTLDALVLPAANAVEADADDEDGNVPEDTFWSQAVRRHGDRPRGTGRAVAPSRQVPTPAMATCFRPGAAVDGRLRLRLRHRRPRPRARVRGATGARHPLGVAALRDDDPPAEAGRGVGVPCRRRGHRRHVLRGSPPRGARQAARLDRRPALIGPVARRAGGHLPHHGDGFQDRHPRGNGHPHRSRSLGRAAPRRDRPGGTGDLADPRRPARTPSRAAAPRRGAHSLRSAQQRADDRAQGVR